jgi:acyl transferase domain-containing protein/acyl carrier protein
VPVAEPADAQAPDLRPRAIERMKEVVGLSLNIPVHRIDPAERLEQYGIDSITVLQLTNRLRGVFRQVTSALFFEHQTISALVDHFVATQPDATAAWCGLATPPPAHDTAKSTPPARAPRLSPRDKTRPVAAPAAASRDIAIVGLSARLPEAANIDEFWANLAAGRNCISEIPADRWSWRQYFDPRKGQEGRVYTRWGGFVADVDRFDPLFFRISPREAQAMDPQERLFLQEAYASIEDAGHTPATLSPERRVGVYVGVMNGNYPAGVRYWSIANRVSHVLDFRGPSIAVDTACSSSLSAIHLAVDALLAGDIDCALAGGVNLIVAPSHFQRLAAMTMLSAGNQVRAFGADADGFIAAEAVGVLVLRPLARALADGDQIRGVIKASALNAGGRTNGYTVPNPLAQADLVQRAYQRAGIKARQVSYVEAHGTGTALGDPVEIAGLCRAFAADTSDRGFCAIGSVKTNIGHCESAAGVAAVAKVLLQMEHGQLVPSLHNTPSNPEIDFSETPFRLQRTLEPWQPAPGPGQATHRPGPRLASVSSFGAGGANAVLILEEHLAPARPTVHVGDQIVLLSARSDDRLIARVRQLRDFLATPTASSADLAQIAYTTQIGREAMEHRCAIVATSLGDLRQKLEQIAAGSSAIADVFRGQARRDDALLSSLNGTAELAPALAAWVAKGQHSKLAQLWTEGLAVDWRLLHGDAPPGRCRLPSYPFAGERYWIDRAPESAAPARLGRWLHENLSTIAGIAFRSTFDPARDFVDHAVSAATEDDARPPETETLPASVCLEMVLAAVRHALPTRSPGEGAIWLTDLVHQRQPASHPVRSLMVDLHLRPEDEEWLAIEVSSTFDGQHRVHLHGAVRTAREPIDPSVPLDIESMVQEWQPDPSIAAVSGGVAAAFRGPDDLLVELCDQRSDATAASVDALSATFTIAAAWLGRSWREGDFQLSSLQLGDFATSCRWLWIRGAAAADAVDVDLCDATGRAGCRLSGLLLPDAPPLPAEAFAPDAAGGTATLLAPVWQAANDATLTGFRVPEGAREVLVTDSRPGPAALLFPNANVLTISASDDETATRERLAALGPIDHVIWAAPRPAQTGLRDGAISSAQAAGVLTLFRLVKGLLAIGHDGRALSLTIITSQVEALEDRDEVEATHGAVHGFVGSLAKEQPRWAIRLIDLPADQAPSAEALASVPPDRDGDAWVYRRARWYRRALVAVATSPGHEPPYRTGGLYVIIGGAGGIGVAFSQHLVRRHGAKIVWLGRRALDSEIQAKLDSVAEVVDAGLRPRYYRCDATDPNALRATLDAIRTELGPIHGVVHSTIVLSDQTIARMDEARLLASLAAKLDVAVNLASALELRDLDFVLFFSSLNSFGKAAGQANYAAGCTFVDAFAAGLRRQRACPIKVVNWGYWGDTGIVASAKYRARMEQAGVGALDATEAMAALDVLMSGALDQLVILKTTGAAQAPSHVLHPSDVPSLISALSTPETPTAATPAAPDAQPPNHTLSHLRRLAAETLGVHELDLDPEVDLLEYGFDQLKLTTLAQALDALWIAMGRPGRVTAVDLAQHRTLAALATLLGDAAAVPGIDLAPPSLTDWPSSAPSPA